MEAKAEDLGRRKENEESSAVLPNLHLESRTKRGFATERFAKTRRTARLSDCEGIL